MEQIKNQLKRSLIEFCILQTIAGNEVYASDILENLQAAQLLVVEGTLYPLLSRLTREGLVDYKWVESESGPPRKYYSLTTSGQERLASFTQAWQELTTSINLLITQNAKDQ